MSRGARNLLRALMTIGGWLIFAACVDAQKWAHHPATRAVQVTVGLVLLLVAGVLFGFRD